MERDPTAQGYSFPEPGFGPSDFGGSDIFPGENAPDFRREQTPEL